MGFKRLDECVAFDLARQFKREVYAIVKESSAGASDGKFVSQLFEAVSGGESNIAEGFYRLTAGEIVQFLRYGLSSLAEAVIRLEDGIDRGHFPEARCRNALKLGHRAIGATRRWHDSLQPFLQSNRRAKEHPRRPTRYNRRLPNTDQSAEDRFEITSDNEPEPRTENAPPPRHEPRTETAPRTQTEPKTQTEPRTQTEPGTPNPEPNPGPGTPDPGRR